MSKNISNSYMLTMPSGNVITPQDLFIVMHTDVEARVAIQQCAISTQRCCCEMHIIKTAQRLEELNSWVSLSMSLGSVWFRRLGMFPISTNFLLVSQYISSTSVAVAQILISFCFLTFKTTRHLTLRITSYILSAADSALSGALIS